MAAVVWVTRHCCGHLLSQHRTEAGVWGPRSRCRVQALPLSISWGSCAFFRGVGAPKEEQSSDFMGVHPSVCPVPSILLRVHQTLQHRTKASGLAAQHGGLERVPSTLRLRV